jgi:Mn2+/Fe2+ NRAMP family transporter
VGVLLWLMNREDVLGIHRNRRFHNITGGLIFVVSVALGWRALIQVASSF